MEYTDITFLRRHCRTEEDEDDYLTQLADSAESLLGDMGIIPDTSILPAYRLAVAALVLHWHDNPGGTGTIPESLDRLVTSLKQRMIKGVI